MNPRMHLKSQEKMISGASILNKNNLYKLLVILRDMYPAGYLYENLKKRVGIKIMPESQLKELINEGLLKLYDIPEQYKKSFPEQGKMFPQYMITKEGMNFLTNIEVYNLNKKVKFLTQILVEFGIVTILLMILQLFF
ncbi:MAG: hypothetical protein ABH824_05940 [Nanoarchaeota archaeon]